MSPAAIPTDRIAFKVHSFEPGKWLLWTKPDSTWAWHLTATDDGGTRLVTRNRAVYDWRNPPMALLSVLLSGRARPSRRIRADQRRFRRFLAWRYPARPIRGTWMAGRLRANHLGK